MCLAALVGGQEKLAAPLVDGELANEILGWLRVMKMRVQRRARRRAVQRRARGSRHNDVVTPRPLRLAAADEMRQWVDRGRVVASRMRVRVDVRMKSRTWTSDKRLHADDGTGQRPSGDEIRDRLPSRRRFRVELAIHVRVEHGIVVDGGSVLRPLIELSDGCLAQLIESTY